MIECSDCGGEIPKARLKALPKVRLCISCQEVFEKEGKFVRHVMDIQPEIESWENVGTTQELVRGHEV